MELILPKTYLSYSAASLWNNDKNAFRDRYYRGIAGHQTPEQLFGHKIAKMLESGEITDTVLKEFIESKKLPLYPKREYRIEVTVHGVRLLGVLDSFDDSTFVLRDQKTGRTPWTKSRVDNLMQLAFYSMLVKEKHGEVSDVCFLDYMQTDWLKSTVMFDGIALEGQSDELFLTGFIETFERIVTGMDRYRVKEWSVQTAHEISNDWAAYKKNNV